MLVRMSKVHVFGHIDRLDETLACLHRLSVMHIIDVSDDPTVTLPPLALDDAHVAELEDLRYLRARVEALISLLPDAGELPASETSLDLAALRAELDHIGPQVEGLVARLDQLRSERDLLPRHVSSLRRLLPLVPELTELERYDTTALLLDSRHPAVLAALNARLQDELDGNFEILSDHVDADTIGAVLVFPKDQAGVVSSLLGQEQVSRIRLPERFESVPFRVAIVAMERRTAEIPAEIANLEDELARTVGAAGDWVSVREMLRSRIEQLQAVPQLGATQHTFSLSGWVPRTDVASLRETISREVGDEAAVEEVAALATDRPPVLMANPQPARPFEFLVRLLATPQYGSLDPTTLMMIFLPLFFGMMLGDIVYGSVLGVIALWASRFFRSRGKALVDLSRILVLSALWSIAWGVVYGEFLGDLGAHLFGLEPIWINREEALAQLLVFAIAVGGAHVLLGLVLGIRQALRSGDRKLIGERSSLLVAMVGLFVIVGVAADQLPDGLMTPGVAAVVVGMVVLIAVGGPMGLLMGPLEMIGTIGNVLSYLRLAAIGLASVFLARIANELGATGPLWLGIIVATLFHVLNLALGTFSPTIQALRLHYVEFFGKFYEEGGQAFQPFGADSDLEPASVAPRVTTT